MISMLVVHSQSVVSTQSYNYHEFLVVYMYVRLLLDGWIVWLFFGI